MSSSAARRYGSTALTLLSFMVTGLCAYNVFGDNADVVALARTTAGCDERCGLARVDRNPVQQRFELSKKGGTVIVTCSRSAWLVGAYACAVK